MSNTDRETSLRIPRVCHRFFSDNQGKYLKIHLATIQLSLFHAIHVRVNLLSRGCLALVLTSVSNRLKYDMEILRCDIQIYKYCIKVRDLPSSNLVSRYLICIRRPLHLSCLTCPVPFSTLPGLSHPIMVYAPKTDHYTKQACPKRDEVRVTITEQTIFALSLPIW